MMANHSSGHQKAPNKLKGSIAYLMGPIDRVPDFGKGWRIEIVSQCRSMGIKFLDPTNKVSSLQKEVDEEQKTIREMKESEKWDELSVFMKRVVRDDHRCIDLSDFMICYIDMDIHMCGTYFELQSVLTQKKPYFIIMKGGKKRTPSWLFGIIDHRNIYSTIEEVVDELKRLDSGEKEMSDRWVLIRNEIAYL